MGYLNTILILAGISVIAVLGLAILTGYTGLFSIGHSGFMALGAYTAALLVMRLGIPLVLALLAGGLCAGLSSLLIGYPTLRSRLRGDYFAITTLGFAEVVRLMLNNTYPVLGGSFGLTGIPSRTTLPIVLLTVALAFILAHSFTRSQWGRNCIACKQDPLTARLFGVNVLKTQLSALFISAFYTGVAGGLFAFFMAYLTPSMFTITRSSELLAAVMLGGVQSLLGPALAAFILVAVPELLRFAVAWRLVIYGLMLVITMIWLPQGLLGYRELNLPPIWVLLRRVLHRLRGLPGEAP